MNALDSKPRTWPIWCAAAFIPVMGAAGWFFGEAGVVVSLGVCIVLLTVIEFAHPMRAPTVQDHMTKNPGRGS